MDKIAATFAVRICLLSLSEVGEVARRVAAEPQSSFAAICEAVALPRLHRAIFRHSARTIKGKAPDSVYFSARLTGIACGCRVPVTDKLEAVELQNRGGSAILLVLYFSGAYWLRLEV